MGHSHWPQVSYSELISVLIGAMVFTVCYNVLAHHCPIAALCCCELNTNFEFVCLVIGFVVIESRIRVIARCDPHLQCNLALCLIFRETKALLR